MRSESPIGIFDSGIGGLTIANAISHLMPQESLIYYGDTAHLPYGDKSPDAIRYYTLVITKFLRDQGCKAVVIACNSASAVAYDVLSEFFSEDMIIVNAVDPLVSDIISNSRGHVGIIGTRATIESGTYQRKLHKQSPHLKVSALPTPLLAPMVEDHFHKREVSSQIIASYLSELPLDDIDALALACTHYPLIEEQIIELLSGRTIRTIDSATPAARQLYDKLRDRDLLSKSAEQRSLFYLSDTTRGFQQSAEMFFGKSIEIESRDLWTSRTM